ncbi:putative zinc finger protein [Murinocardiopsis flavida]|uniref:Putative zinc finger protein n=1 Tax=Murinocardiopsis flavida TaxID=645275 RepID=A0A2P8DJH8_9ACTN|nr:zf-HC2 domain-containing protein [Murinocardiopsis flavida]PSK97354.1 putative zinc finger protein [Murinocardiopsis flavida]
MTRHLGERLSALVDGELGHAERERALSHLAVCQSCRFEAEMTRSLKRRLHGLDTPAPSMDFMGRLSSLTAAADDRPPAPPPSAPPGAGTAGGTRPFGSSPPLGSSRPIGGGPARRAPRPAPASADPPRPTGPRTRVPAERRMPSTSVFARRQPVWGRARFAVAGMSVAAVALGTAFVAGGEGGDAPLVRPPLDDYALEHAVTAQHAPLPGPMGLTPVDHSGPDAPGGGRVVVTTTGDGSAPDPARPR